MIRKWLSVLLLLSQHGNPSVSVVEIETRSGPSTALIMLIAVHRDGSPARGTIACDGIWVKHADEAADEDYQDWDYRLPFTTDSRGAVVFNPSPDMLGDRLTCYAESKGQSGSLTLFIRDGETYSIVVE